MKETGGKPSPLLTKHTELTSVCEVAWNEGGCNLPPRLSVIHDRYCNSGCGTPEYRAGPQFKVSLSASDVTDINLNAVYSKAV